MRHSYHISRRIISAGILLLLAALPALARKPAPPLTAEQIDARGQALYQQGKYGEADASFLHACLLDGSEPLFQTHLGLLLIKQTKYGELVSDFRKISAHAPDAPSAHFWLGRGLVLSRQSTYAEPELRTAVTLAPDRWIYHYYLAAALNDEGKSDEAVKERAVADKMRRAEPRETP